MKVGIAFAGDISGSGGMQRACVTLANALSDRGHDVVIGYGDTSGRPFFFSLSQKVHVQSVLQLSGIQQGSVGKHVSGRYKIMRELLRPFSRKKARAWNETAKAEIIRPGITRFLTSFTPDVIISFGPDMTYYLLNAGCKQLIITLFRIEPRYILDIAPQMEIEAVKQSAAVQIQMPFFAGQIEKYCGSVCCVCIPNPVSQVAVKVDREHKKDQFTIIDVARVDKKQKRQHLLLEAFARVAEQNPTWSLEFWGNTTAHKAYAEELIDRIHELHMENRIFLKGETRNIADIYNKADIFAFPSAFEGFPNALAEAMVYGLPVVIAGDCPSSNALVVPGKTGLVAGSVKQAAEELNSLMEDTAFRNRLGNTARQAMMAYAPEQIWMQWEELLNRVVFGG